MAFRYKSYNYNDLLMSAYQKRPKSIKATLLVTAIALSGTGIWLGTKHATHQQPITTIALAQVPVPQTTETSKAIIESLATAATPIAQTTMTPIAQVSEAKPVASHPEPVTQPAPEIKHVDPAPHWQTITLKKGDTLGKVFSKAGLSAKQLQTVMTLKEVKDSLKLLKPGNQIKLLVSPDKKLQQLSYALNAIDTLEVSSADNALSAKITHQKVDTQISYAAATVARSFSQAAAKAGLQGKLAGQLISIFKDKIDITRVKAGDRIKVLFEEDYIKGKKVRTGNIVAAEVQVQGKPFSAVRYVDAKGNIDYYTPEGQSLKRGFVRYPLNYSHISSGYILNRVNPVTGHIANHKAIDFAAPMGTPIKAAGDGKIAFAGMKGAYGNVVVIKHDSKYQTLYAHMQHFAANVRPGSYVKLGQVIGYVGRTGRATGPHLHYEFHVNGVKSNPLTVALPSAAPLNRLARAKFIPQAHQWMARLHNENVHLVENHHSMHNG